MMLKPWRCLSPSQAPDAPSPDLRPRCTSAAICVLLLMAASCALVAYSAFFSDQLLLPSRPLCTPSSFNHILRLPPALALALGPSSASPLPTDLSHLVFAIGASAHTWHQRRHYIDLWWLPNRTRGHVWLDHPPLGPWPHTSPPYRLSRDMSRYGNRASASRIAAAVVDAYRLVSSEPGEENVRWFVMGDDDTVFFLDNLLAVLQKYDHHQPYYVGMPSESVEQDVMHSYGMAFGGGGFAISYPAAAELAGVMDACLDRYAFFYGSDQRVQACLSELGIPLTREPGFHQV